jgi:iron complex transport system substrate-binding protein
VLNGQSIYHLDTDLLAELAPDLILTQELCEVCAVSYTDVLAAAQALPKVPEVVAFEPHTIEGILASIGEVARLAGVSERGEQVVAGLRSRLAAVAARTSGGQPPRVLCLEWLLPPMVGGHWVPEMVRLAGGVDVLGPEGQPSTYVTWEQIAAADPDVIIVMPCGYDLPATRQAMQELDDIPDWHTLRAVREGRFYPVDGSSYFNRPGPRVVDGVELLARLIHPEA